VARVITRLNVGGPAIQALLLTERLDPERYETILLCGRPGPREGDMLELRGIADVRPSIVPALGREISLVADLRALWHLVRLLRAYRPDIVHTHLAKAGLLGRVAARAAGARVVVHTFHGNVLQGYFGPVRSWLLLQLERVLARISTAVVSIAPSQSRELTRLGIGDVARRVELPLGLDLAPFLDPPRGEIRRELGLAPDALVVGIVARLVPIKDLGTFLLAAQRIARARPEVRFLVVGDGPERGALEGRAEALGLAGALTFLGWRADLAAIYGDCDVVLLTSRNEGTPVSLIEALAAGRAVVATRVGGVPDVVEGCGILVPAGDDAAVAAAALEILSDPGRRERLGRAGRDRVYPAYDAATLVTRIDSLYQRLLGRPDGR